MACNLEKLSASCNSLDHGQGYCRGRAREGSDQDEILEGQGPDLVLVSLHLGDLLSSDLGLANFNLLRRFIGEPGGPSRLEILPRRQHVVPSQPGIRLLRPGPTASRHKDVVVEIRLETPGEPASWSERLKLK